LAFKADIDDLRESPAMEITLALNKKDFKVIAVEPNIKGKIDTFELVSLEAALEQANIFVLLVDHKSFKLFKPKSEYIVDTKGVW